MCGARFNVLDDFIFKRPVAFMEDIVGPLKPRADGLLYADDLTASQFMAVMDTFTETSHHCPVCNTRQWSVQLDVDEKPVLLALPSSRDESDKMLSFFMVARGAGS